tara:strand:- start:1344 stop:2054 length:711 start_codon:yes stop_codon:yes gene_type:complete
MASKVSIKARIYLDWDLTAACFSFDGDQVATPDAVKDVLKSTYDSGDDTTKQDDDVKYVAAYMQGLLKPLLERYPDRITILTANSASNVEKICTQYEIDIPEEIYSVYDQKVYDQKVTKLKYLSDKKYFMFLDDSEKEIQSVKSLASEGVIEKIVRPKLNSPATNCGMFGKLNTEFFAQKYSRFAPEGKWNWHAYIDACLIDLDKGKLPEWQQQPLFESAESAQYRTFVHLCRKKT